MLASGLALAVAGVVVLLLAVGPGFFGALDAPIQSTPLARFEHFDRGTYAVYELSGSETTGPGYSFSTNNAPTLQPSDVTVTSESGNLVTVTPMPANVSETLNRNGAIFTAAVRFTTPSGGQYSVVINAPPGTRVVISRDLGSLIGAALPGIALGVAGFIAMLVGAITLGTQASRRRRLQYATLPPAGYYPDPYQPGQMRWWTGS